MAADIDHDLQVSSKIELAARLHDIGKISVPDRILLKAGPLSYAERELMQTHCTAGAELIEQCELAELKLAADVARNHHENWDGSGYPAGKRGEEIPFAARVTALAETFDALTHARPYRAALTVDQALQHIIERRGTQFDPDLTDRFVALIEKLRSQDSDLDVLLGEAARRSSFLQARAKIAESLEKAGAG